MYNYYEELKNVSKKKILKTSTIEYRVTGFISSMKMNLEPGNIKEYSVKKDMLEKIFPFINQIKEYQLINKNGSNYNIDFYISELIKNNNKIIKMTGYYDNSAFEFTNYYGRRLFNNCVFEVPFELKISSAFEYSKYVMHVVGEDNKTNYCFTIEDPEKNKFDVVFSTRGINIFDTFNIVREFMSNPPAAIRKYNVILNKHKFILSKNELDNAKNVKILKKFENKN